MYGLLNFHIFHVMRNPQCSGIRTLIRVNQNNHRQKQDD